MKLIIAKIVYFGAMGLLALLGLSLIALLLINIAPVFWSILGILLACVPLGMAFGWSEKTILKQGSYKKNK